jgi:ribonucleoside-diphosphate reductase beta chain
VFRPSYGYFLQTAASLQWDEAAVDLAADRAAWPALAPERRERLTVLLAGFCVGEASVADELEPFVASAPEPRAGACFRAQARDEARHARFFDRVAEEVSGVPGAGADERRLALRPLVGPSFLELFEERLPRAARELAGHGDGLGEAVAFYHLLLEGVVFTAGQLAMLEDLEADGALPGLRRGVELVLRDERWHIGFGTRALTLVGASPGTLACLVAEADAALAAWGGTVSPELRARVVEMSRRRLRAARLSSRELAA